MILVGQTPGARYCSKSFPGIMKSGNHDLCKQQQQRVDQTKYDCFGILETKMIPSIFKDFSVMTDVTVKMRGKTQKERESGGL